VSFGLGTLSRLLELLGLLGLLGHQASAAWPQQAPDTTNRNLILNKRSEVQHVEEVQLFTLEQRLRPIPRVSESEFVYECEYECECVSVSASVCERESE
jgi:hypothetical protein